MLRISVFVSGGGTNFQAIIDAIESKKIKNAEIVQVISSTSNSFALERAKKHGIAYSIISRESYPNLKERTQAIIKQLKAQNTNLIVLAGYMNVLQPEIIAEYRNRIINIHPSLIPKFCGKGFYGIKVHQAVIDSGDKVSGATVHYVDEGVDTGPIIIQEKVDVLTGDTPEKLAERILVVEHKILTEAVRRLSEEV